MLYALDNCSRTARKQQKNKLYIWKNIDEYNLYFYLDKKYIQVSHQVLFQEIRVWLNEQN